MTKTQQKPTQEQINQALWEACDTFRGVIDPGEYKNYILVFMFLKYLSDVWKDTYEQYREKYGNDEELIKRKMQRERFFLPEDCTFDYIVKHKNDPDIGEKINKIMERIEDENKQKLEGVFRNVDFNSEANLGQTRERNELLKNLINDFNKPVLDFRPSVIQTEDIIGNSYMYLIEKFASDAGKKGGEFFTPRMVSELVAKLMEPQQGSRISDPACGSGSLLINVAAEIGNPDFAVYGQERNGSTWALAKMNMFLHKMDRAQIEWGDTITNPKLLEGDDLMKFDVVVANPPFSLDKWGAEHASSDHYNRFHRGIPPKSKGDFAFITHMIESAVEGTGKVGVIVPHGVLFRGSHEGKIRQQLIDENLLDAVVGLPSNLFYGTGIPAAILIFNKGKGDNTDVLFIDASRDYQEGRRQNELRDQDIEKVVDTFREYKEGEPINGDEGSEVREKYAYRATLKEIQENDYNLNIPRYVDTFEEEEPVDIEQTQQEIEELESELQKIRKEMDGYLKELGFKK